MVQKERGGGGNEYQQKQKMYKQTSYTVDKAIFQHTKNSQGRENNLIGLLFQLKCNFKMSGT
jgi:hypothetical protein